jgi:autotransporter translocation and assembly factor TamB
MTSVRRHSLFALVIVLAAAWVSRSLVMTTLVRHFIRASVQTEVPGLQLRFHDLETNLFFQVRIQGLDADYCRGGECLRLSVPTALVTYSLSELLPWRGQDTLLRHLKFDLQGASLSGDFPAPGATAAAPATTAAAASSAPVIILPVLPVLPAITIRNGTLALKVRGTTISGQGLRLEAPSYDPGQTEAYQVKLAATTVAMSAKGVPAQQGSLETTLALRPGRLEVPSLFFKKSLLLDHGVLTTDSQGLSFAMGLHLLQSQGQLQGAMNRQKASLSFHLKEGDLKILAEVAGGMPLMSGHLRADGEVEIPFGQPEGLKGSVTALVQDGSWNGVKVDRLEVAARAVDRTIAVERLALVMGPNQATIHDGVVPIADLVHRSWLPLLAASRGKAEVTIARPEALPQAWSAFCIRDWQDLALASAHADLDLNHGQLLVPEGEVSGGAGRVRIKDGKVDLTGQLADWQEIPWSVQWQAELTDAAVVRHFWEPWPATGGSAHGHGSFSGTLARPHLPFEATFERSSLYQIPLDQVAGRVEWTKDRLALDLTAHNGERDRLTYQGAIDLDQGGLIATKVSTEVSDMHPYLPKALIGSTQVAGPLTASVSLAGLFSRLTGPVEAKGDWTVEGVQLSGAELEGGISGGKWSVERLSGILGRDVGVTASGWVKPGNERMAVGLQTLALSYQDQSLSLLSPAEVAISPETIVAKAPLTLTGEAGQFRLEGGVGGKRHLKVTSEAVHDTGLLREVSGREVSFTDLGFTLDLSGALTRPDWRWQGTVKGLAVTGAPLSLTGGLDLASDSQGLWLRQGTLGNETHSVSLSGHLPLSFNHGQLTFLPGPLDLKGSVVVPQGGLLPRLFPEWLAESSAVKADLNLSGTWDDPRGQVQLSATGLKPGPRLNTLPAGIFDVHGQLDLERDAVRIARCEVTSPGLNLSMAGAVRQIPWSNLINGRQDSLPGLVEVKGRYSMPDLSWLANKAPGLRRTAGSASGAFVVGGPLAKPEIRADLSLRQGEARGSDTLLVFRDGSVDATLDGGQLTIATFAGTLGGSPVHGSGTVKGFLASDDPGLDLHLTGKDLLLYRADGVKIRANATLTVKGSVKAPVLAGEVMLTDSRITKRVDWLSLLKPGARHKGGAKFTLFSFKDPPLNNTRLDLRVKTATPLVIANNVFKGGIRSDLLLAGTGEVPYLAGVVYADSGSVTLPSGRLDVDNGLIRFAEDEPDRPQLEFQATGRMMGYDITAQVRGALDEPEVTLSSSPPLGSEDLLMLILTGRHPVNVVNPTTVASATDVKTTSDVSTVAVYLSRGLLGRLFGEQVDQAPLLDRLEVDMGRAVTQQGEPTVDARVKLADGLWKGNTSLYLTGEKDSWDYYNAGLRLVVHFR